MRVIPQLAVALLLYFIIVTILFLSKPALLFNDDGSFKKFATGFVDGNSVFAVSIVLPILAFICYIFASLFKLAIV
jgi:hypothetical protein